MISDSQLVPGQETHGLEQISHLALGLYYSISSGPFIGNIIGVEPIPQVHSEIYIPDNEVLSFLIASIYCQNEPTYIRQAYSFSKCTVME
jgi:hypothetical protein